ncbi:hypothetical protein QF012_003786 [Pseudomonas laurylsulfatiphila]
MLTDDPTNLVHAMLMGARATHTEAHFPADANKYICTQRL